jgi:photosystem II stability/assembly factor-like uncharacterized protein
MNKHKRSYLILPVILLLGTYFTLGFSNITNNADADLINQPSDRIKPGFNGGVGWVVGENIDGYGTILHTTDGGDHWVRQGTPDEIPDVHLMSVSTIDACNAWVVGGKSDGFGIILRTEDGGETWKRQDLSTIPTYNLSGVYASDASHVWVVGGLTGNCPDNICGIILNSKNSGKTWKQMTYVPNPLAPGGYLILVHGLNAKTVWVVGNGTVQQTTDGGETWQEQVPGISFFDYNGVFAVKKNTVWVSRDADGIYKYDGTQWHNQTSPKSGFYNLRISALDTQTAWLVGRCRYCNDEQGIIYHTTTGGDIWEAQDPGTDAALWGVSFVKSGFCNSNR